MPVQVMTCRGRVPTEATGKEHGRPPALRAPSRVLGTMRSVHLLGTAASPASAGAGSGRSGAKAAARERAHWHWQLTGNRRQPEFTCQPARARGVARARTVTLTAQVAEPRGPGASEQVSIQVAPELSAVPGMGMVIIIMMVNASGACRGT